MKTLKQRKKELLRKKNVAYVIRGHKVIAGTYTGIDCITVAVTDKVPLSQLDKEDIIPPVIDGIETDVVVDEMPKPLRKTRRRPMPGGVSVSHPRVSAGTGSTIVLGGEKYIISCNHVLANSNDCSLGDQTWQPGSIDGGSNSDTIAHLYDWVPIRFVDDESDCPLAKIATRCLNIIPWLLRSDSRWHTHSEKMNTVDVAVSKPLSEDDLDEKIIGIGLPTGFVHLKLFDVAKKSGRTTTVKSGTVLDTEGLANVDFGRGRIAQFEDQIITESIGKPGDSGSLVCNEDNMIGGLLFAGSDKITLINKISNVLSELGFVATIDTV